MLLATIFLMKFGIGNRLQFVTDQPSTVKNLHQIKLQLKYKITTKTQFIIWIILLQYGSSVFH